MNFPENFALESFPKEIHMLFRVICLGTFSGTLESDVIGIFILFEISK